MSNYNQILPGGENFIPEANGTQDLGSIDLHFANLYVDNIIPNPSINPSGLYLPLSGGTLSGTLIMASGYYINVGDNQGLISSLGGQNILISASAVINLFAASGINASAGGPITIGGSDNVNISTAKLVNITGPQGININNTMTTQVISGTNIFENGSLVINTVSNSGLGVGLANSKVETVEWLNSISGLGSVTITGPVNGVVNISGSTTQYQPVGNYVTSGSSTILNVLNATVISGTTISGNWITSNSGIGIGTTASSSSLLNIQKTITGASQTLLQILNDDNSVGLQVISDSNGVPSLLMNSQGFDAVNIQGYWPSYINSQNYINSGGLVLGASDVSFNTGYGLYVYNSANGAAYFSGNVVITNGTLNANVISGTTINAGTINAGTINAATATTNGSSVTNSNSQTNISVFSNNGLRIIGDAIGQDSLSYQAGLGGGGAAIAFGRGGSWDTFLSFYTNGSSNAGGGSILERMRIIENGNIGINTITPQFKLDVSGTINSSSTITAQVISGTTISGNAIFASGIQIIPSNYQPIGNYVVSGSSTILNILDATVISGTTISGNTYSISENMNPIISGHSSLGSAAIPFSGIYSNQFFNTPSEVWVYGAVGYGSTATKIRVINGTNATIGSDITYRNTASGASSFTINRNGVYAISYTDETDGNADFGISKNSSQLTTSISAISASTRLAYAIIPSTTFGSYPTISITTNLISGDVIRPHTNGNPTSTAANTMFRITKII